MEKEIIKILKNKQLTGNDIIRELHIKKSPRYIYGYLDCLVMMHVLDKKIVNKKFSYFEVSQWYMNFN